MAGENNIATLIKEMAPILNAGDYIFSTLKNIDHINRQEHILTSGTPLLLFRMF